MRRIRGLMAVALLTAGTACWGAASGTLTGDWKTPGGSVVRVGECGQAICMKVIQLGPTAKGTTDNLNPDAALKGRPLCGMQIGEGFVPDGADAAKGGKIYDPESGKTYSAKIAREGGRLKLRGFIGVSMFGRTEVWTRAVAVEACK